MQASTGRRAALAITLAVSTLATAGAAQAQSWGVWVGDQPSYGYARPQWGGGDWAMRSVCSGDRAHRLEDRVRHELDEGEIDPDTANRMHAAIDRLEDRSRDECSEGDRRAIWGISQRFDRIQSWIDREAHGGW